MKIAFLFAGQYRPIPKELLRHSIPSNTYQKESITIFSVIHGMNQENL